MKKMIASMLLCTGLMAFAQQGEQQDGQREGMKDLTPEQIATLQTKKMILALDLSTAQQEEIQKLNLAEAKFHQGKREARKEVTEKGTAEKRSTADRYERINERLDNAIVRKGKMKEILTEAQFEKWEKMHQQEGHHRYGKRHEKKGHRARGK